MGSRWESEGMGWEGLRVEVYCVRKEGRKGKEGRVFARPFLISVCSIVQSVYNRLCRLPVSYFVRFL